MSKLLRPKCEICRENAAVFRTAENNRICDVCAKLYHDAHNLSTELRASGWPHYKSILTAVFCGFILTQPTPVTISPIPNNFPQYLFPNNPPPPSTYINLDDPRGTLMQVYCYPTGGEPFCVEYER